MLSGFSTRTVRFLCLVQLIFAKGCSTTTIRNASIKEDISLGKLDDSAVRYNGLGPLIFNKSIKLYVH